MKKTVKNLITWLPSHLITSQKSAFTLAEVLITLAIIGVVAAMTIPTLIADYKERELIVRNKKAYSLVTQALTRVKADSANISFFEMFGSSGTGSSVARNFSKYFNNVKFLTEKHQIKYMKPMESTSQPGKTMCDAMYPSETFSTNDMYISVWKYNECNTQTQTITFNPDGSMKLDANGNPVYYTTITPCAKIMVDVNGEKGPNQLGKDAFALNIFLDKYKFYCTTFYGCVENVIKNDKFYENIVDYEIGADFTN